MKDLFKGWDILAESLRMHINNARWWHDLETGEPLARDPGEISMLMISELAEAMEGIRKNLQDDKLPQYKMEHVEIVDALIRALDARRGYKIEAPFDPYLYFLLSETPSNRLRILCGFASGFADSIYSADLRGAQFHIDAFIYNLFVYAEWRGFLPFLREIYEAKVAFNLTRFDHSKEGRLAEGGKAF